MAGKRLALIVATDEYLDPGLGKLRAPARDAEALAAVLADPELGDFEVDVLRNGTSWAIAERVESLLTSAARSDLVVLHFSCHGIKDPSGELYLAATNTRPNLLASTAIDSSLVTRLIRRSLAQRAVLFLDCCFGGAFERGVVPRAAGVVDIADQFQLRDDDLGDGRGRVIITASNAMEFAFEGSNLADSVSTQPSIFTGAIVEGLTTGAADRDQDGMVSLGELYEYVFNRVRDATPDQTPGKWEFGLQGDLVLAKNPQRVVVPAPVPADLLELIEHPFPATRVGAVGVLVRLAEGTNLPIAAGARAVLERMVADDSRSVAKAAEDAIARTGLRLTADSIDLGTVRVGEEAKAEVSIEGVPLATASRAESSSPGIRVSRADRTIRIEADTSVPGHVDGTVTVVGPAGSADIHVSGVVSDRQVKARPSKAAPKRVASVETDLVPTPIATSSSPTSTAAPELEPSSLAAVPGSHDDLSAKPAIEGQTPAQAIRRPFERGLQTGHVQTLIGAELGSISVWLLWLTNRFYNEFNNSSRDLFQEAVYIAIWLAGIIGVWAVWRLAGPHRSRTTLIALAFLYPAFRGWAQALNFLDVNVENFFRISLATGVLALLASSVVRLKRPLAI